MSELKLVKSKEEFERLKQKVIDNGLWISKIPRNTKKEFRKYAEEEWKEDWGAAFTYIFKFFKGECSSNHEEIHAKLEDLNQRLIRLETKKENPESEIITLSGKKIR